MPNHSTRETCEGEMESLSTHPCGNVRADYTSSETSKAISLLSSSHCSRYASAGQVRQRWRLFSAKITTSPPTHPEFTVQLLFYTENFLTKSVMIHLGKKILFFVCLFFNSSYCCPLLLKERSQPSPPTLCSCPSPPLHCSKSMTGPFLSQLNLIS